MRRKGLAMLLTLTVAASLTGCGSKNENTNSNHAATQEASGNEGTGEKEKVALTVWGAEEDQTMLQEMIDEFEVTYADTAEWDISLGVESESTAKDTILTDIEAAADVFAFADDQLNQLVDAGALQPIELHAEEVTAACGGADAGAVQAATKDGKLYAYPMTADNGYFMFYNSEYFTEDDVQSLDKMLEIAAGKGKQVSMQLDEGWYLYSFFKGAGLDLTLNEDGLTNSCNWNATDTAITGVQVTEALLNISGNAGFVSCTDEAFASGVKDGSIIAGVNGTWNAAVAQEAWGENYAATKLPAYTCNGEQVQMSSFAGYKLIGVNAYSEFPGYAMMLGEWLTNYDNQVKRFEQRGLGPANVEAAASDEVKASPAIAALSEQSQFATVQRIGDKYWSPAQTYGAIIAAGNSDKVELQTLVDNLAEGITASVE